MSIIVRAAVEADFPALCGFDLTYPTSRYLLIERSGAAPEHTFTLRWRQRESPDAIAYAHYSPQWFATARAKADLFLVAEVDGAAVGLLIAVVPSWTDAAEITDLAIDRGVRRLGARKALVEEAAAWARDRRHRALWVEPRADNAEGIEFYLRLGFRVSSLNADWQIVYMHRDVGPRHTTPVRLRA
jgi:ribosomal protein S18 acetylase RimI-like enzyme